MTELAIAKPADTLEVRVNGVTQRVFMSFNLLRKVADMVGQTGTGPDAMTVFLFNGAKMGALVDQMLAPKTFNPASVQEHEIDHDEAMRLIAWGIEHAVHFFLRSLEEAGQLASRLAPMTDSLMHSANGSSPFPLTPPAPGPLASPVAA